LDQEKSTDSSLNDLAIDRVNHAAVDAMSEDEDEEETSGKSKTRRAA
jgi:hypothetical protein